MIVKIDKNKKIEIIDKNQNMLYNKVDFKLILRDLNEFTNIFSLYI